MSQNQIQNNNTIQPIEGLYTDSKPLVLESGAVLYNPTLAYQTWGKLNEEKSNVIWVCHALTGNHRVHEWWDGLFGTDKLFDPKDYFIVCVNVFGSAYGSSGPYSKDEKGQTYFHDFPKVTIRDMVAGLELVRKHLGIDKIKILIGASVGGQQVLEWVVQQPELAEIIIPIATNIKHSPFGIAFNETQRLALEADPEFFQREFNAGKNGLIAARAIGMLSYRTYDGYGITQSEKENNKADDFRASSYQRYQGEKLANRFNALSYWYLTKAMDSHNLERGRENAGQILAEIKVPVLVVGIDSDALFPIHEQEHISYLIPNADLASIKSSFGHDGFLVEFDQLAEHLNKFLKNIKPEYKTAGTTVKN